MSRTTFLMVSLMSVLSGAWVLASPVPKPKPVPREDQPNSNAVLKKFANQLSLEASSVWAGYPVQNLIDEKLESTWYSENGDCKAREREPWLSLTFPEDATVNRVTVYGSRDPQFPVGYGVLEAQILLINAEGKTLVRITRDAKGDRKDFDFLLGEPLQRVRVVKFRVIRDESQNHPSGVACVALAEIRVE